MGHLCGIAKGRSGAHRCRILAASAAASRYAYRDCERRRALSESEDWSFGGRRVARGTRPSAQRQVSFDRRELDAILRVYGRKVAEGEWRDYAIDHLEDRAVFSIFRRASEMPMYRVEKVPALGSQAGRLPRRRSHRADPEARARAGQGPRHPRPAEAYARPRLGPSGKGCFSRPERTLHQHGVQPAPVLEARAFDARRSRGSRAPRAARPRPGAPCRRR